VQLPDSAVLTKMIKQAVILLTSVILVCPNPLQEDSKATQYLAKYGYLNTMDLTAGVKSFQKMSGLTETGSLDDDTVAQMGIPRCGANDIPEGTTTNKKDVMRYAVIKYPESSLLSDDNIDNVILTAANLWKNDHVEIVKNLDDDHDNDIEIVFCDFTECLVGFSAENDMEELARPVEKDGKTTLYLDSAQSWADDSTLSKLSYGGVMHLQVQLLQVVLHQFGHAMGLEHSGRMSSAMVPFYMEWVNGLQPDKEDFTMIVMSGQSRVKTACWQLFALSLTVLMLTHAL